MHNDSLLYVLPAGAFHNILLRRDGDTAIDASRTSTLRVSQRKIKRGMCERALEEDLPVVFGFES